MVMRTMHARLSLASALVETTVDPIVRRLLASQALHERVGREREGYRQDDDWGGELQRQRRERLLLALLRDALRKISEVSVDDGDGGDDGSDANISGDDDCGGNDEGTSAASAVTAANAVEMKMSNQLNAIAAPLYVVMQQQPQLTSSSPRPSYLIMRSATYACIEEAAHCLSHVWKIRQCIATINTDRSGNSSDVGSSGSSDCGGSYSSDVKTIRLMAIPALVSCAVALSYVDGAVAASGDGRSPRATISASDDAPEDSEIGRGDEKKVADHFNADSGMIGGVSDEALDTGEDCALAILSCMQSFFIGADENTAIAHGDGSSLSPLAREVGSAMNGALVARLVQGCLSLLTSSKDDTELELEALKTIQSLLNGVPIRRLWGSILPGCFAGMYRVALDKLRYSSGGASSYKVASLCVELLGLLLKSSLGGRSARSNGKGCRDNDRGGSGSIQSITSSLMAAVRVEADAAPIITKTPRQLLPPAEEREAAELKIQVNQRLPGPISVLLHLLPTSEFGTVRKSGLHLCRTLLIETRPIWTERNAETLGRNALEYCLVLLADNSGDVSALSREILQSFKVDLGPIQWKRRLSRAIVPTILELVEALPAFAKSGREAQIKNTCRLIDGYLVLSFRGMTCEFDVQECLGADKRKSDIGTALSCTEAVDILKRSFSIVLVPDIDSITCSPMIELNAASTADPNCITLCEGNCSDKRQYRHLYLRDESAIDAARTTIHLLARTLGTKRCAFLLDSCFAEMYKSCCSWSSTFDHARGHNSKQNLELSGVGFLDRRLKWSGTCIFASELLKGLPCKLSKSEHGILSSLASSVLPVIVSNPLWTLPTTMMDMHLWNRTDEALSNVNAVVTTQQSAAVMNSNSILITTLMEFICQMTLALGDIMKLHLPTALFPLLERATPMGNHPSVQRFALTSLKQLSITIGHGDIPSLLASNFDYLVDTISLRLSKCEREQCAIDRSVFGVVNVILQSVVHRRSPDSSECGNAYHSDVAGVGMVGHMLNCLLGHFDRQSYMTNLSVVDTVKVFQSMNRFMDASIDFHTSNSIKETPQMQEDWFQRLDFELSVESGGCEEEHGDIDQKQAGDSVSDGLACDNGVATDAAKEEETSYFAVEVNAINGVLTRCCYLLCYVDLRIQVLCCETMLLGFTSLGKIGSYQKASQGESACNPLLPAIAEFWPSIITRLRSASASLASVNRLSQSDLQLRHIMAAGQDDEGTQSKASLEVLISKLILVVSEFCCSSDGFFADRYQNDVYPIIAQLMHDILPNDSSKMGILPGRKSLLSSPVQKHHLVLPIIHSLRVAYESSCRYGLASLISAAGTMLLPLLSVVGGVGDASMLALKAMLSVDSDILWREIHVLSGRVFPCKPINMSEATSDDASGGAVFSKSQMVKQCDSRLSKKATELLVYIAGLPEQQI